MKSTLRRAFPIFVLPTLIAFTIGFVIPFIMGVYLSFCKFTVITNTTWVGLDNYKKIFQDGTFLHALGFTIAFTVVSVITINLFAFIVAMFLTKKFKGTKFFRTVFFMPNLIGGIILGYIWQIILNGILACINILFNLSVFRCLAKLNLILLPDVV